MAAFFNSFKEAETLDYLIAVAIWLPVVIPISILWVNAIDKAKKDPEWQKHKDDPDYWDWN